jgi:hypothetical protein
MSGQMFASGPGASLSATQQSVALRVSGHRADTANLSLVTRNVISRYVFAVLHKTAGNEDFPLRAVDEATVLHPALGETAAGWPLAVHTQQVALQVAGLSRRCPTSGDPY